MGILYVPHRHKTKEKARKRDVIPTLCLTRCVERGIQPQSDFVLDLESQPVRSSKKAPAILKI